MIAPSNRTRAAVERPVTIPARLGAMTLLTEAVQRVQSAVVDAFRRAAEAGQPLPDANLLGAAYATAYGGAWRDEFALDLGLVVETYGPGQPAVKDAVNAASAHFMPRFKNEQVAAYSIIVLLAKSLADRTEVTPEEVLLQTIVGLHGEERGGDG